MDSDQTKPMSGISFCPRNHDKVLPLLSPIATSYLVQLKEAVTPLLSLHQLA